MLSASMMSRGLARGIGQKLLSCPPRPSRVSRVAYSSGVTVAELLQQCDEQPYKPYKPEQLSIEDRLAITDLVNRFDHTINMQQQHTLGELFVSDAEVHHPGGTAKGASEVVDFFLACAPLSRGNRHLTVNTILDATAPPAAANGNGKVPAPRTARATSYRLLHRASNPPLLLASGTILDDLVWCEEDQRWRFVCRRFIMDPPAAAGDAQQRALQQQ